MFCGDIPGSRIAGLYGGSILAFLRSPNTVVYSGCASLHFHQKYTSLATFVIYRLFDDSHSEMCEVIVFNFHFSNN